MADGKTYIVPAKDEPTFWNKEAIIGTFMLPIPVVGTVVGGLVGKARMERESQFGKPIDPPSFWNKDTYIGAIAAIIPAIVAGLAGFFIGGALGTGLGPLGLIGGAALGGLIGSASTMVAGAAIGGVMGKERIRKEYSAAEALVNARDELNIAQGKAPGHTPSKELSQELASGFNGLTYAGDVVGALGGTLLGLTVGVPFLGLVGELGGAVAGGLIGKSNQQTRYAQGDVVTREEALQVEVAQRGGTTPQRGQQISIEEAKLLEQRLTQMQGTMQDRLSAMRDAPSQQGL